MERRDFLRIGATAATTGVAMLAGCRGHQYGQIVDDSQADMVGSHTAGAATFNPLINESVAKLLGRQEAQFHMASAGGMQQPVRKRICFVGVENRSAEELGDFREQIYEQIDSQILQAPLFESVSRRAVDAALFKTRMRPDLLFLEQNRQIFAAALQQEGQPFDYLLYAKLTSGTTQSNHDYQRDYLLTLELVNVYTGQYDKESAKIRKGYHQSRVSSWKHYNPFNKQ